MQEIIKGFMTILEKSFEVIVGLISSVPKGNQEYSSSFVSETTLLSIWNKGLNVTGTKKMPIKTSFQNFLVCSPTGGGKTSTIILPNLYNASASYICNDPSGEVLTQSAGYLKQKGYDIKVLNFTKPQNYFNPISRANSSSEINKVSAMLIENTLGGKKADPFWNLQAQTLIFLLISILKTQPEEYQNLANVRHLCNKLSSSHEEVDELFKQFASDNLFSEYTSFIGMEDKVLLSVVASAKSALAIFADESVAHVTSSDDIDFQSFRDRKTILYIQSSVADMKYYSSIISIFFEQFFGYALSRFPTEKESEIFLLIDEASSLRIPTISTAVANCRKMKWGVVLLYQDWQQAVNQYGKQESDSIKSNCYSQLYFSGQGPETCSMLENLLGKCTYTDKEGKKTIRPLMDSSEIRTMPNDRALLICGNQKPIQVKLTPHYKQTAFKSYSQIPPPLVKTQVLFEPVQMLSLKFEKSHEQVA